MKLPNLGANPVLCFEKYCDAIMDLLLEGLSPGIKESIVDLYGKPELLFFGPDGMKRQRWMYLRLTNTLSLPIEGTADLMNWAACGCQL